MILELAAITLLVSGVALLLVAGMSMLRVPDSRRRQLTAGLGNLGATLAVLGTIPFVHQGGAFANWVVVFFLVVRGFVNGRLLTALSRR